MEEKHNACTLKTAFIAPNAAGELHREGERERGWIDQIIVQIAHITAWQGWGVEELVHGTIRKNLGTCEGIVQLFLFK